jgi:hypothetical protein
VNFSTLKTDATCSSEAFVYLQLTTRPYTQEDRTEPNPLLLQKLCGQRRGGVAVSSRVAYSAAESKGACRLHVVPLAGCLSGSPAFSSLRSTCIAYSPYTRELCPVT